MQEAMRAPSRLQGFGVARSHSFNRAALVFSPCSRQALSETTRGYAAPPPLPVAIFLLLAALGKR